LAGNNRQRFTVKKLDGEWARVEREDGSKGRVSLDKLLASDAEGTGVNYRFHGWRRLPRGYRTDFEVLRLAERTQTCLIALPEWDPAAEIEVRLNTLPNELKAAGAGGSCRADLTAKSEAELSLHGFSAGKARGLSRTAMGAHPKVVVGGQEYRRREDGKRFRILEVEADCPTVPAWSGRRVVRLNVARLLAKGSDSAGIHYCYIGGGRVQARRGRAARRRGTGQSATVAEGSDHT